MAELISVVVPVYRVAADLPRCLDSILAQTYDPIEIIAVDDGSPDDSGAILDAYAEKYPNIRVIHKENGGVTTARLCGVEQASGAWIGFVDGDDEIEPDMYQRLMDNAVKYEAQISHCGYQMCFPDGRVHYFHNTGIVTEQDRITALKELLSGAKIEPGLCNKLFRKELFHGLIHDNVMDKDVRINEDLLMNYYLFSATDKTVFEDVCPYHYIVRASSASRQKRNKNTIFDPIRVKRIILDRAPDDLKDSAKQAYLNTCLNICNSILTEGRKEYTEELKKVRAFLAEYWEELQLLGHRRCVMAKCVLVVPGIYGAVYRVYEKYFQTKPYV